MKNQKHCIMLTLAVLAALAVTTVQTAHGTWANLGTGDNDSEWEWESVDGLTVSDVTKNGDTSTFKITGTFSNMAFKAIRFKTRDGKSQDERFFMVNMDITNSTNKTWSSFQLRTVDAKKAGPYDGTAAHPVWAHIHPSHSVGDGPSYAPYTTKDPNVTRGVATLTVSGGDGVAHSAKWEPARIRLHDKYDGTEATGAMDFTYYLQPFASPEPSTLFLAASGLAVAGFFWRRRRTAK